MSSAPDRRVAFPLLAGLALLAPGSAHAWPTMLRHGYTGCAECHAVPTGGGPLTEYGRAQAATLLPTSWREADAPRTPGPEKDFLFGILGLPEALALQFDHRSLLIPRPDAPRWILMQNDLRARLHIGRLWLAGELGYANEGAWGARVTSRDDGGNLVSREHWLGFSATDAILVRAGRLALPFGIRSEEHMLLARQATRTDTNADQQHGLAVAFAEGAWRGELMGIAGNFQLSPDDYRERGASGLLAWALSPDAEIGLSGLFTVARLDADLLKPRDRQAWGVFGRASPAPFLVVAAEGVLLHDRVEELPRQGLAGYLQADARLVQGLHLRGTGEWCDDELGDELPGVGSGGLGVLWFLASRVDLRLDGLRGVLACAPGADAAWMGLAQLHFFL
jgi:hypothetical protein